MSRQHNVAIQRLVIENYRSLGSIDVKLEPLTVLVGANGAGKTNLLDAIRFVRDAVTRGLPTAISERRGMAAIRRWSRNKTLDNVHIQLFLAGDQWSGDYGFTISGGRRATYRVTWEKLSLQKGVTATTLETANGRWVQWPTGNELPEIAVDQISIPDNGLLFPNLVQLLFPSLVDIFHFLGSMSFYGLFSESYSLPQAPADPYPLAEDGRNLASVLRYLKEVDQHRSMIDALGSVAPDIVDYMVHQIGGYLITRLHHTAVDAARGIRPVDLGSESAGIVHILAILAALYQTPPRALIALEEPDSMIHEAALGVLADVLREVSLRSQLIITTHSPELVSRLPLDTLRIVENQSGVTRIGPISEIQRTAVTEQLFSLGDLMRMEGLRRQPRGSELIES